MLDPSRWDDGAIPLAPPLPSPELLEEPDLSAPSPPPEELARIVRKRPGARRRNPATRILPSEPALFGWLADRFSPGEATLWAGSSAAIEPMLEMLYAGCALADGRVSLLEGANRFHPYRIGERGRNLGVAPEEVLERVRLARAFTAYQLVALVDAWSKEAKRNRPTLLVAHDLPALFFTEEVPEAERAPLLTYVAERLSEVVSETGLPLLLTLSGPLSRFPGLTEKGPRFFDWVRFLPAGETGMNVEAFRDASRLRLVTRSDGQRGLEEFASQENQEVIMWGVPSRRTARRSRSG
ncbi:MAG: hypothetical protein L3K09_00460 [Thermoplasmata archaeon]|nr:hypothetical protein [Thermoplasmata archaeon]